MRILLKFDDLIVFLTLKKIILCPVERKRDLSG